MYSTRFFIGTLTLWLALACSVASAAPPIAKPLAPPVRPMRAPPPHVIVMGEKALPEARDSLLYRWVDVKGQLIKPLGWRIESQWVWRTQKVKNNNGERVFQRPVRRTWIAIPPQFKLARASSGSMKEVVELSKPPFDPGDSKLIAFDANDPLASVEFTGQTKGKKELDIYTLIIEAKVKRSRAFIHSDCIDADIELTQTLQKQPFFFTGIFCEVQSDKIDMYVTVSTEVGLKRTTLSRPLDEGNGWFYYQLDRPQENWVDTIVLGSYQVVAEGTLKSLGEYGVRYVPQASVKRTTFSVGLAASYVDYKESASSLTLKETALTGKITGSYILLPRLLDVAMSAYLTLWPVTYTASKAVGSARFYGLNGRLGYRLPIGIGAVDWSFLVGWYFWGMIVKQETNSKGKKVGQYGVQINGPQVFISMRSRKRNHRMYGGYVKYAPLSDGSSYKSTNREIAFGAHYQLNSPKADHVWSLTLDIAQVKFARKDATQDNSLQMLSYSLGVSRSF